MRKKPNLDARLEKCAELLEENGQTLRGHWRDHFAGYRTLAVGLYGPKRPVCEADEFDLDEALASLAEQAVAQGIVEDSAAGRDRARSQRACHGDGACPWPRHRQYPLCAG